MPHSIRLRGPWEYTPLARLALDGAGHVISSTENLPPAGRVQMPCDWGATLGADFRGRVRYERPFGRPTGLESGDRLLLVFDAVDASVVVALNGQILSGHIKRHLPDGLVDGCFRFALDITGRLDERNRLTVGVELLPCPAEVEAKLRGARAGLPGGLIGEVRLEIRAPNE